MECKKIEYELERDQDTNDFSPFQSSNKEEPNLELSNDLVITFVEQTFDSPKKKKLFIDLSMIENEKKDCQAKADVETTLKDPEIPQESNKDLFCSFISLNSSMKYDELFIEDDLDILLAEIESLTNLYPSYNLSVTYSKTETDCMQSSVFQTFKWKDELMKSLPESYSQSIVSNFNSFHSDNPRVDVGVARFVALLNQKQPPAKENFSAPASIDKFLWHQKDGNVVIDIEINQPNDSKAKWPPITEESSEVLYIETTKAVSGCGCNICPVF